MFPYIISCLLSLLFMNIACKHKVKLMHLLAIVPPIILLTYRGIYVGTDTHHYVTIFSLLDGSLSEWFSDSRFEPLYTFLMYAVKTNGGSINMLFFVIAVFTIVPVYMACIKMARFSSPVLSMFIYYMVYYNYSFNISRQAAAMSLILLATVFLLERNFYSFTFITLIAILFHYMSVVYLGFVGMYIITGRNISRKYKILSILLLVFLLIFATGRMFYYYESSYLTAESGHFQNSYVIGMAFNFFLLLTASKNAVLFNNRKTYLFFSFIALFLILLSPIAVWFYRLALMVDIISVISIPHMLQSEVIIKKNAYKTYAYIFYSVFFWYFVWVLNNTGETMPYTSIILGIK